MLLAVQHGALPTDGPERDRTSTTLDQTAALISMAADHGAVVALLSAVAILRRRRSIAETAASLAIVGLATVGINSAIKSLVGRERPSLPLGDLALPPRSPSSSSFPSGHTLAAACAATALTTTPMGTLLGLEGAALVGWSRLRLRVHHRSDVGGGYLIGMLLGLALRPFVSAVHRECGLGRRRWTKR